MEVSFILSKDELLTLIVSMPELSEAGEKFVEKALFDAEINDLSGLFEKNMAKQSGDEIELEPIVQMIVDSIATADSCELNDDTWIINSPWLLLECTKNPYLDNSWKITPIES